MELALKKLNVGYSATIVLEEIWKQLVANKVGNFFLIVKRQIIGLNEGFELFLVDLSDRVGEKYLFIEW
jgi:hypothetical protein